MALPVIHDGDHGGDDFITSLLFCAYPALFNLLGVTTVSGNAGAARTARNAAHALGLAGRGAVPVIAGSEKSYKGFYKLGDDAFGSNGLGDIALPATWAAAPVSAGAVDWMAETLRAAPEAVTLCATGPLTNIAHLLASHPALHERIARIIVMGGGINPAGNIKPWAEFNFFMDPDAADLVLNVGVPVVLHTLDTTHQTVYTAARQARLKTLADTGAASHETVSLLDRIMRITEELERKSFGSEGSFFHDHQVCAYLAMPENYETAPVKATVLSDDTPEGGRLLVEADPQGHVHLVTRHIDTEKFFAFLFAGLERILRA